MKQTFGLLAAITLLGIGMEMQAANWTTIGGGDWLGGNNWDTAPADPNGEGAIANLAADIAADAVITLNGNATVGNMTIADGGADYYSYTISGANTLTFDNTTSPAYLAVSQGAANRISVPVALTDNLWVTMTNSSRLTISGDISGNRYLDLRASSGTLRLEGDNTFTGGTYLRGNPGFPPLLELASDTALGTGSLSPNNYTTVTLSNVKGSTLTLANSFNPGGAGSRYDFASGDFLLTGTIYGGGNGGPAYRPATGVTVTVQNGFTNNLFQKQDNGILRILGASTANLSSWSGGTIEVHHAQALGTSTTPIPLGFWSYETLTSGVDGLAIANNFTGGNWGLITDGIKDFTLSGVISGGMNFRKNGVGILTLSGNNSYSGGSTISNGMVVADHNSALGIGPVTMTGGTLAVGFGKMLSNTVTWSNGTAIGGSGTYQRATDWLVPTSFTIAPGLSTGTLTLDVGNGNTVNLRSDTTLEFEFASASDYDKLVVTNDGILNLAGATLDLDFGDYKPGFGQTFDVFSATTINNDIAGLTGDYAPLFTWDISGGVLTLTSQVPEPASLTLLALAGVLTMTRRRKSRVCRTGGGRLPSGV